ncbi:aspartate kinase [Ureibacillus manganicus]|uniref:Aspartokinase n=1 Tax=Ureibacillus manganicus DSM 26584 TaxID=1384049 RepID=A0A0A3I2H3_9BACL|nr:aspartate kinase [Ureibacillus manganicus]KGR78909.1 aspartate kinase [Ureibacillus manganicus DSM 26584]
MIVCKFGGTSVASAEQIKKVANIVKSNPERKIIVVSAPGKRYGDDIKVTDLLIDLANAALKNGDVEGKLQNVVNRYKTIADDLGLDQSISNIITQDLRERVDSDKSNVDLFVDSLKASGEDNNAKLIAAYFNSIGLSAKYVSPQEGLVVNNPPERTVALPEAFENLNKMKNNEEIIVFPGFFGYTKEGTLRTFDRGGSDITGSILAAAVKADLYENFTDVDCVFTANPKVVKDPVGIEEITYREMRELSYSGFSVFHDEALMPVFKLGIPVNIKNTNNPSAPGTKILPARTTSSSRPVTGISADSGFSTLYVSKYLMNREIGFGRKLLHIIEDEHISYDHTPSGVDDISVIIRSNQITPEAEERIVKRIKEELHADDVYFRHGFSMIVIVGEGMRNNTGLAARAASAISKTGSNIEMINQGSSEVSLVFGVLSDVENEVLTALYGEFFTPITVY